MKGFLREYLDILIYTLSGVILVIGSYNIIFNVNHANALRRNVVVRDNDTNYKEFKGNVLLIENKINDIKDDKIKNKFTNVLKMLENDGIYKFLPYNSLSVNDLYDLNNYFTDVLINSGWVIQLKELVNSNIYNDYIKTLVNSYEYINNELLDNSSYYYNVGDKNVRDALEEEYDGILKNYLMYSRLVLNIMEVVGGNNA